MGRPSSSYEKRNGFVLYPALACGENLKVNVRQTVSLPSYFFVLFVAFVVKQLLAANGCSRVSKGRVGPRTALHAYSPSGSGPQASRLERLR